MTLSDDIFDTPIRPDAEQVLLAAIGVWAKEMAKADYCPSGHPKAEMDGTVTIDGKTRRVRLTFEMFDAED